MDTTAHGMIMDGEAPESDDEIASFSNLTEMPTATAVTPSNDNFFGSSASAAYSPSHSSSSHTAVSSAANSILHKKLAERNVALWMNLNGFIQSAVGSTSKQLLATDQALVQSQLTLQTVSRIVKQLIDTSAAVLVKSNDVLSANFLSDIKEF